MYCAPSECCGATLVWAWLALEPARKEQNPADRKTAGRNAVNRGHGGKLGLPCGGALVSDFPGDAAVPRAGTIAGNGGWPSPVCEWRS